MEDRWGAAFVRIAWQASFGLGGSFAPDWVAGITGIRTLSVDGSMGAFRFNIFRSKRAKHLRVKLWYHRILHDQEKEQTQGVLFPPDTTLLRHPKGDTYPVTKNRKIFVTPTSLC